MGKNNVLQERQLKNHQSEAPKKATLLQSGDFTVEPDKVKETPKARKPKLPDLKSAQRALVLSRENGLITLRVYHREGGYTDQTLSLKNTGGLSFDQGERVLVWEQPLLICPEGEFPLTGTTRVTVPTERIDALLRDEAEPTFEEALGNLLLAAGMPENRLEQSVQGLAQSDDE